MIEKILGRRGTGRIVQSLADIAPFKPSPVLCMDIETWGAEDQPGDSPFNTKYAGISGLAVANQDGDSIFIQVADLGAQYATSGPGGVPVMALAGYFNKYFLTPGQRVTFHNAKFDLGFLIARGFDFSKTELFDTWILHSLACNGVFVSNKLKDIMKQRFNVAVESDDVIKTWLELHKTKDYGKIPLELLGKYGCDDVLYGLALYESLIVAEPNNPEDAKRMMLHRMYVKILLELIAAETVGFGVDVPATKAMMEAAREKMKFHRTQLDELLRSTALDVDDDQQMLNHLHFQNLHPGPYEKFGERKYWFDREFLKLLDNPVVQHYRNYYVCRTLCEEFSTVAYKGLKARVTKESADLVTIHPNYLQSVFSKGGLIFCKRPDLLSTLGLNDTVRGIFRPRPGYKFVALQAVDVPLLMLSYYAKDKEFQFLLGRLSGKEVCEHFSNKSGLKHEAVSLLFNQLFEGHGDGRLISRLRGAGVRAAKDTIFGIQAKLISVLPAINDFKRRLLSALEDSSSCNDIAGGRLLIKPDERWRAPAKLISSGYGNVLSVYLLRFLAVAAKTGARLVFIRENEFLFEAPAGDNQFTESLASVLDEKLLPIVPTWMVMEFDAGKPWRNLCSDAHRWVIQQWVSD